MLRCLGQPFFDGSLEGDRIVRRWSLCRRDVSLAFVSTREVRARRSGS
jgi:hypothetical protein